MLGSNLPSRLYCSRNALFRSAWLVRDCEAAAFAFAFAFAFGLGLATAFDFAFAVGFALDFDAMVDRLMGRFQVVCICDCFRMVFYNSDCHRTVFRTACVNNRFEL